MDPSLVVSFTYLNARINSILNLLLTFFSQRLRVVIVCFALYTRVDLVHTMHAEIESYSLHELLELIFLNLA